MSPEKNFLVRDDTVFFYILTVVMYVKVNTGVPRVRGIKRGFS